jgi:hypothetical protein
MKQEHQEVFVETITGDPEQRTRALEEMNQDACSTTKAVNERLEAFIGKRYIYFVDSDNFKYVKIVNPLNEDPQGKILFSADTKRCVVFLTSSIYFKILFINTLTWEVKHIKPPTWSETNYVYDGTEYYGLAYADLCPNAKYLAVFVSKFSGRSTATKVTSIIDLHKNEVVHEFDKRYSQVIRWSPNSEYLSVSYTRRDKEDWNKTRKNCIISTKNWRTEHEHSYPDDGRIDQPVSCWSPCSSIFVEVRRDHLQLLKLTYGLWESETEEFDAFCLSYPRNATFTPDGNYLVTTVLVGGNGTNDYRFAKPIVSFQSSKHW